ncbi:hypothetical protein BGZ80_006541, partial [Entomortierella chlamydospora]
MRVNTTRNWFVVPLLLGIPAVMALVYAAEFDAASSGLLDDDVQTRRHLYANRELHLSLVNEGSMAIEAHEESSKLTTPSTEHTSQVTFKPTTKAAHRPEPVKTPKAKPTTATTTTTTKQTETIPHTTAVTHSALTTTSHTTTTDDDIDTTTKTVPHITTDSDVDTTTKATPHTTTVSN